MKKLILFFLSLAAVYSGNAQTESVDIPLGPLYPNQIYYRLYDHSQVVASATAWDLGFITNLMSGAVISNGKIITVYQVPGADSSDYATLDTSGYQSWPVVYNSDTTWYVGALNVRANAGNPFDFGWGIYDFSTHAVFGDSLFLINKGGSLYKFWLRKKTSTGDYVIRYKNLSTGAADVNLTIPAATYSTKNFVYLNLDNPVTLDFEPVNTDWDILFTNYISNVQGLGPYLVTGALTNLNVFTSEARGVDTAYANVSNYPPVSTNISEIGYDWKEYDFQTATYTILDSLTYFVRGQSGDKYSIVFSAFDNINGVISFNLKNVSTIGINDPNAIVTSAGIYPNPAKDHLNLLYESKENTAAQIHLMDVSGREVMNSSFGVRAGFNQQAIHLPELSSGMYQLMLQAGNQIVNLKVLVQ